MNILPKKSWHVRNKDNIARVRLDEENARLEEEKSAKRAALAEQEARTKLLRDRVKNDSKSSSIQSTSSTSLVHYDEPRHINLFSEEGTGSGHATTNAEYEAEKKVEQEKKEKALGVLKYLGQSTNEDPKPWYLQKEIDKKEKSQSSQDIDRKSKMDPLVKITAFLDQTKQAETQKKRKQKKEKKEHKKKSRSGKRTMEELRAERLQREKAERFRAEKLIKERKEGKSENTEDDPYQDSYYSQYNPGLAKKPKWNKRHHPY